jgi:hypothetical protein
MERGGLFPTRTSWQETESRQKEGRQKNTGRKMMRAELGTMGWTPLFSNRRWVLLHRFSSDGISGGTFFVSSAKRSETKLDLP